MPAANILILFKLALNNGILINNQLHSFFVCKIIKILIQIVKKYCLTNEKNQLSFLAKISAV